MSHVLLIIKIRPLNCCSMIPLCMNGRWPKEPKQIIEKRKVSLHLLEPEQMIKGYATLLNHPSFRSLLLHLQAAPHDVWSLRYQNVIFQKCLQHLGADTKICSATLIDHHKPKLTYTVLYCCR